MMPPTRTSTVAGSASIPTASPSLAAAPPWPASSERAAPAPPASSSAPTATDKTTRPNSTSPWPKESPSTSKLPTSKSPGISSMSSPTAQPSSTSPPSPSSTAEASKPSRTARRTIWLSEPMATAGPMPKNGTSSDRFFTRCAARSHYSGTRRPTSVSRAIMWESASTDGLEWEKMDCRKMSPWSMSPAFPAYGSARISMESATRWKGT